MNRISNLAVTVVSLLILASPVGDAVGQALRNLFLRRGILGNAARSTCI